MDRVLTPRAGAFTLASRANDDPDSLLNHSSLFLRPRGAVVSGGAAAKRTASLARRDAHKGAAAWQGEPVVLRLPV